MNEFDGRQHGFGGHGEELEDRSVSSADDDAAVDESER